MNERQNRAFFSAFYQEVAGMFDGDRTFLKYEHGRDQLVGRHESIHQRLVEGCPDGQLLSLIVKGKTARTLPGALNEPCSRLLDQLVGTSRFAHEALATYLSVKTFDVDEHSLQLGKLPAEYVEYYRFVADVIDPLLTSSYLQYVVVWNIGVIAFSSGLFQRFASLFPNIVETVEPSESPTNRLTQLLGGFNQQTVSTLLSLAQHIAGECARRREADPWDIQSETGWKHADRATVADVEMALARPIRRWIEKLTGVTEFDYTLEFAAAVREISTQLGVTAIHVGGVLPEDRSPDIQIARAREAGRSVILNSGIPRFPLASARSVLNIHPSHRLNVGAPDITGDYFRIVFDSDNKDEAVPFFVAMDDKTLLPYIYPFIIQRTAAIVLGLQSDECLLKWKVRLANFFMAPEVLRAIRAECEEPVVFWYLHGSYTDWLDTLAGPLFFKSMNVISNVFPDGGGAIRILKRVGADRMSNEGFWLRFLNIDASAQLSAFEESLLENGKLVHMPDSEMPANPAAINAAVNVVTTAFPRL